MSNRKKYLIAVAASLYVGTASAQTITFNDGQPGHVLQNTTVDRVTVSNYGTEASIGNVTVNGTFGLGSAAKADLNQVNVNCSGSSCSAGIHVSGVQGSLPGDKGILTGDGVRIQSGKDGIWNSAGSAEIDLENVTITAGNDGVYTNGSVVKNGGPYHIEA